MHDLVPIFICAIMPIAIVLIVFLTSMNSENKRAKVLIKAIESNNSIDADKLAEALSKPKKTPQEILNLRLLRGCIFFLIGLALVVYCLITAYSTGEAIGLDAYTTPLIIGLISIAIGVSYLVVYFVTRGQIKNDTKE